MPASTKLMVRLPPTLAERVAAAAEQENKLVTEWIRDKIREALEAPAEASP